MIRFDHLKLRQAVCLLLDHRFGAGRAERVRDAIRRLPKRRSFQRALKPLEELMNVAEQRPTVAMEILYLADIRREKLHKEQREATPGITRCRDVLARNTTLYRKRRRDAVQTEEIRLGRRLTDEEAAELLERKKASWKAGFAKYKDEHPELKHQDALAAYATLLNEKTERALERAKAVGPNRKLSDPALRALRKRSR